MVSKPWWILLLSCLFQIFSAVLQPASLVAGRLRKIPVIQTVLAVAAWLRRELKAVSFLFVSEGTKIAQLSFLKCQRFTGFSKHRREREPSLGAAVPANAVTVGLQRDASEAFCKRLFFQQPAKCSLKI